MQFRGRRKRTQAKTHTHTHTHTNKILEYLKKETAQWDCDYSREARSSITFNSKKQKK